MKAGGEEGRLALLALETGHSLGAEQPSVYPVWFRECLWPEDKQCLGHSL